MAVSQVTLQRQDENRGWIERELDENAFQDVRLGRRMRVLFGQLAQSPGQSLPLACQDWANTYSSFMDTIVTVMRLSVQPDLAGRLR